MARADDGRAPIGEVNFMRAMNKRKSKPGTLIDDWYIMNHIFIIL